MKTEKWHLYKGHRGFDILDEEKSHIIANVGETEYAKRIIKLPQLEELARTISEQSRDNPEMIKSIMGAAIVDEANRLI